MKEEGICNLIASANIIFRITLDYLSFSFVLKMRWATLAAWLYHFYYRFLSSGPSAGSSW